VGFRPFVCLLANECGLNGEVSNGPDGVQIHFNANANQARFFLNEILNSPPSLSRITDHSIHRSSSKVYSDFKIIESITTGPPNLLITPDAATCSACHKELFDLHNRRKNYPFITCTHCGPRYSILESFPYDRERTAMKPFQMCTTCHKEYRERENRRFHAQTNSCSDCGISLTIYEMGKEGAVLKMPIRKDLSIVDKIVQLWRSGAVIALKGVGGYLLTCDAGNAGTVRLLRKRKHRPHKPFAMMFPDWGKVEKIAEVSARTKVTAKSSVSPIVLLPLKKNHGFAPISEITPGLDRVGIMLPYTPLFYLLLAKFAGPIIATSGNISQSPIVFQDDKALKKLSGVADFVVSHDQEILVPQDDSVCQFSWFHQQKIVLRRSRGLAPAFFSSALSFSGATLLAMGAMLKSTFTIFHGGNIYISQYLGNLSHFETEESYLRTLHHFLKLLKIQPESILVDAHPDYPSTRIGRDLARKLKIPVHNIQHHKAHFAAVLGENELINSKEPILGVVWDGTGFGEDGQIWGGEFLGYQDGQIHRLAHFEYFKVLAGDKMAREPRLAALSLLHEFTEGASLLRPKFSSEEWRIYTQLLQRETSLRTSSTGRIFDAVAAILNLADHQSYEGQAALLLESAAYRYFKKHGIHTTFEPFEEKKIIFSYPARSLLEAVVKDLNNRLPVEYIAARFHYLLVLIIGEIAADKGFQKIAFSGGVFQNALLTDLIQAHLGKKFDLFFHQQLSPNDENISYGQLLTYHLEHEIS